MVETVVSSALPVDELLSDGSNSEGLMAAHREMVEALREKNMEKGMQALKVHFEYIYEYIDG